MTKKLVVLSGAGISAESGLKTFRDSDGLWEGYDVNEVATPRGWKKNPELVLEFYNMRRQNVRDATPNAAHHGLAGLEKYFDLQIITQNIDDLHERAGSSRVLHLHGEIFKMRSELDENIVYSIRDDIRFGDKAPDGGQLRPHIVWFEEPVPLIADASRLVRMADLMVIIGTSLAVYPAAGLIDFADPRIPKFIVDKNIPYTRGIQNLHGIQKPATEGIDELKEQLMKWL
ncbi:MAG TPA: Sir2 family NAD-dependent protein deacetylase [Puia sp.]|jgi:NAD-dependent deacetylase